MSGFLGAFDQCADAASLHSLVHTRFSTDALPPWHFLEARVSRYPGVSFNSSRDACTPSNDRAQGTRFRTFWPHAAQRPDCPATQTRVSQPFSCSCHAVEQYSRVSLRLDLNFLRYAARHMLFLDKAMRIALLNVLSSSPLGRVFLLHFPVLMIKLHMILGYLDVLILPS